VATHELARRRTRRQQLVAGHTPAGDQRGQTRTFHQARDIIGNDLIATFVNSEIEHMLVVARSVFDLLQEALAHFWNKCVLFHDRVVEKSRKQRPMQLTFSKIVLDKENLRTAEQITHRYSIPASTAEMYAKSAPFFKSVRGARVT
jgi:hypothetical protein